MENLIIKENQTVTVDYRAIKDATVIIDKSKNQVTIKTKKNVFGWEGKFINGLKQHFHDTIFWHFIVNYYTTYKIDGYDFNYGLPLSLKGGKDGYELTLYYNSNGKIDCFDKYYADYTDLFKKIQKIRIKKNLIGFNKTVNNGGRIAF